MRNETYIYESFVHMLKKIFHTTSEIFFPSRCVSCTAYTSGTSLCVSCSKIFYSHYAPLFICSVCRRRIPNEVCSHHPSAVPVFSLFQYSSLIPKKALFAFKYDFFLGAYTPFLPLIETALFEYPELQSYDIAIPIPLHRARLHERGFNQSEIIAQTFASLSRPPLPVVSTLSRIRNTKHQADIHSREEREKNISGAFKSLPYIPDHASLVLVDDVFTTGATTEEAIRTLRAFHPKRILIFTLFRGE